MGRDTIPTAIKKLTGKPGRGINHNEPKPLKSLAGDPPPWLNDEAKKLYVIYGERFYRLGLLTESDLDALACLANAMAMHQMCSKLVHIEGVSVEKFTKNGDSYQAKNPNCGTSKEYFSMAMKLMGKFGMTPSDRANLVADVPEDQDTFGAGSKRDKS